MGFLRMLGQSSVSSLNALWMFGRNSLLGDGKPRMYGELPFAAFSHTRLGRWIDSKRRSRRFSKCAIKEWKAPSKVNCDPYPFQWEAARQIEKFEGLALLADEMGLGKTTSVGLWLYNHLHEIGRAVVVCPASLKTHWKRELKNHFGIHSTIISGHYEAPATSFWENTPVIILNYDILPTWSLPLSRDYDPKLVVMDECHMITNPEAQRTKACTLLTRNAAYRLGLSGTPLTNRPGDLRFWTSSGRTCTNPTLRLIASLPK
jgi:SNF2 family DNA or RNA helicase